MAGSDSTDPGGVGVEAARAVLRGMGTGSPEELACRLGIRVILEERERGVVGSVCVFSAYEANPPTIRLFSDALGALAERRGWAIAHEIFHHLERVGAVRSSDSERSAEAFAGELLGRGEGK